jgi:hypothetical protein
VSLDHCREATVLLCGVLANLVALAVGAARAG